MEDQVYRGRHRNPNPPSWPIYRARSRRQEEKKKVVSSVTKWDIRNNLLLLLSVRFFRRRRFFRICSVFCASTQAAEMLGQNGRANRDYSLAQHVRPWSALPSLLRARLHSRLGQKMEEVLRGVPRVRTVSYLNRYTVCCWCLLVYTNPVKFILLCWCVDVYLKVQQYSVKNNFSMHISYI